MKKLVMVWTTRLVLLSPFVAAAVLTVLVILCDRLHLRREHVAGYVFLFGAPWDWLLPDHDPFGQVQSRWLENLIVYAFLLWIPAVLYSGCLWLLLRSVRLWAGRD